MESTATSRTEHWHKLPPDEFAAMLTKALGIVPIKRRAERYSVEELRASLSNGKGERELWTELFCDDDCEDPYQRWVRCRARARRKQLKPLSLRAVLRKIS